jgi:hypothetical protein
MKVMKLSIVSVCVVAAVLVGLAIAWATPAEEVRVQALGDGARITVNSFTGDPNMTWLRTQMLYVFALDTPLHFSYTSPQKRFLSSRLLFS